MKILKHNALKILSVLNLLFLGISIFCFYFSSIFTQAFIIPGIISFIISLFLFTGIVKCLCKFALKHQKQH